MATTADSQQLDNIEQFGQIQHLQHRIVDLESYLERAGLLGQQLLDQLNHKSIECDELVEHRIALEVELEDLRQRRHAAERQADLATAREQNALAEIDMLKSVAEENDRLCAEKRNLEELLRRSVLEKDQRMQNSIELEEELKAIRTQLAIAHTEIMKYRQKESSKKDMSPVKDVFESDPFNSAEAAIRLAEAREENDQIKQQLSEAIKQRESLLAESNKYKVLLEESQQDKASMQSNLVYYIDAIREKNQEMTELKQEIDSLKASQDNSQTYRSRQGNSIFAEVEDRRLEVESRLEKATARLRVADEVKRRLRSQLNECYVSMQLLAKYTSKADQNYVTSLEKEVMRLRNQVFACSAQFGSNVKDETFTERDLQNNPLAGLLVSERSCTTSLKKRIEKLIVQEDQRTYDLIKLASDLRKSEAIAEKLNKERNILLLRLQEKKTEELGQNTASPSSVVCDEENQSTPTVFRELLTEVVEENRCTRKSEQKINADSDLIVTVKASLLSETASIERMPNQHVTTQQSLLQPTEQCLKDGMVSCDNKKDSADITSQCTLSDDQKADIKEVGVMMGTAVEEDTKGKSKDQKLRGQQVHIVKKTKIQQNPEACKPQ
ncbi:protein Spindly-like isoform X1 [Varroa jacobsoni]|uniref:protein Spindly-like isoform X1 n=1 Tax=Varroa jacobsoni TaxID=62625 RepID=UPI000BF3A284|nr:protein Spindly-like isoform X1 [Varroa jacobsoni]XP_022704155.1 protein Spindly-like isoform X1 [Varroa jacobsoni]